MSGSNKLEPMKIWDFILSELKNEKEVMLMIVIDNTGSSPGRQGFKMAVSEDGEMSGSIGGGIMEFNLAMVDLWLKRGVHAVFFSDDWGFEPLGPDGACITDLLPLNESGCLIQRRLLPPGEGCQRVLWRWFLLIRRLGLYWKPFARMFR